MNLYLIRHAIAEEAGPKYDQLDLILSSPAIRTMETAKIVAKRLDVKKDKLIQTEHLAHTGYPDQLINEINKKYKDVENLALVGHEPYLSALISVLTSGHADTVICLKKGGVCSLSLDTLKYERCARLDWLLAPFQLVEIGGWR
jgi:phosphohistidine phosphatase